MELFLFLLGMANLMFVLGLLFSIQIKDMRALTPAFLSAILILGGAYVEFNQLPYQFVTKYCLGMVGLGYLIWGIYYYLRSRTRPDKRERGTFLLFIGTIAVAACFLILFQECTTINLAVMFCRL